MRYSDIMNMTKLRELISKFERDLFETDSIEEQTRLNNIITSLRATQFILSKPPTEEMTTPEIVMEKLTKNPTEKVVLTGNERLCLLNMLRVNV